MRQWMPFQICSTSHASCSLRAYIRISHRIWCTQILCLCLKCTFSSSFFEGLKQWHQPRTHTSSSSSASNLRLLRKYHLCGESRMSRRKAIRCSWYSQAPNRIENAYCRTPLSSAPRIFWIQFYLHQVCLYCMMYQRHSSQKRRSHLSHRICHSHSFD